VSNFKELVRLGKDATTRYTQAGKSVTGFSAAFDDGWGENKKTVWLDCSGWGERYEKVAQYLVKGAQVVVEGNIGTREHEGKTYITLTLSDLKLAGGKQEVQQERPAQQRQPQRQQAAPPARDAFDDFDDSEIPFD
jgi:single-strand DNA-binding protein